MQGNPSLRERIGGRWAVSMATFWFSVVALVASSGIADFAATSVSAPALIALWLVGSAATAVVLLVADRTVLRNRRRDPVPVWAVAGVGLVVGVARVLVMAPFGAAVGVPLAVPWLLMGALAPVIWVPATALVADSVARQRAAYADLVARLATIDERREEQSQLAATMTDAASAEVLATMAGARERLGPGLDAASPEQRVAAAEDLRATVVDELRPLSHRLYAQSREPDPPVGVWPAVRSLPLFPLATGIVLGLVAALRVHHPVPPIVTGVLAWLVLGAVAMAARRHVAVRRGQFALGVAALVVVLAAWNAVAQHVFNGHVAPAAIAGAMLYGVVIVAAVSGLGMVIRGGAAMNASLEEQVDARWVQTLVASRELARAARDLAEHVHGRLQARLLATSIAIEHAVERDDDEAFHQAVATARTLLAEEPAAPPVPLSLDDELVRCTGLWDGFVESRVHVDPALPPLSAALVRDVARVVEEGLGNARTHGGASVVDITVAPSPGGGVRVRMVDDGHGPGGGAPGMGSAWLDHVAPGAWALAQRPNAGGAALTVDLAVVTPVVGA